MMFARPPGRAGHEADGAPSAAFYACGWMVRPQEHGANTWHAGYLDGTATLLVRRSDGLCWAVLFNSDASKDGRPLYSLIDPLMHKAANAVRQWPGETDLFGRF
jgi:N-acyl-D-amino-acid deacylase